VDEQVRVGGVGPALAAVVEVCGQPDPDRFGEQDGLSGQVQPPVADVGELEAADLPGAQGVEGQQRGRCPGCPPGLRPLPRRNDLGAGVVNGESDDGGFDEFCEFCPSRAINSAT